MGREGISLLFFENYKSGLLHARGVSLYQQVTHYYVALSSNPWLLLESFKMTLKIAFECENDIYDSYKRQMGLNKCVCNEDNRNGDERNR